MPQQTEATNGSANGAAAPPGQAQGAAAKSAAAPPSNRAKAPPTPLPELPEPGTFCASMWQGVEGIFRWGGGCVWQGAELRRRPLPGPPSPTTEPRPCPASPCSSPPCSPPPERAQRHPGAPLFAGAGRRVAGRGHLQALCGAGRALPAVGACPSFCGGSCILTIWLHLDRGCREEEAEDVGGGKHPLQRPKYPLHHPLLVCTALSGTPVCSTAGS